MRHHQAPTSNYLTRDAQAEAAWVRAEELLDAISGPQGPNTHAAAFGYLSAAVEAYLAGRCDRDGLRFSLDVAEAVVDPSLDAEAAR